MTPQLFELAQKIVTNSDRSHPADRLLREEFRGARGLSRVDSLLVSRAVFAYFRWLKWLDTSQPLKQQIARAQELADQFARNPESFSDEELIQRALPEWISKELVISP